MNRVVIFLLAALLLLVSTASAFDGKRKGVSIGIGGAIAPYMNVRAEGGDLVSDYSGWGWGIDVVVGYGFDERNVLLYQKLMAWEAGTSRDQGGLIQGANHSLTYYRYFSNVGGSMFLAVGINRHYQNVKDAHWGTGYSVGIGRELTKRLQAGVYYINGWNDVSDNHYRNQTLMVAFTMIWK